MRSLLAALAVVIPVVTTDVGVRAQESRSLQDMMFAAIRLNDMATVRSSVASGLDVAKRAYGGKTAIDVAVDLGRFEIAAFLVAERRRQREEQMAAMGARTTVAALAPAAEVVQPSAEAPPEIAPSPPPIALDLSQVASVSAAAPGTSISPVSPPRAATPANEPGTVTPQQLLAMAHQLAAAAEAMANAQQRPALPAKAEPTPPPPAPVEVATATVAEPFLPRPGRKPVPDETRVSIGPLVSPPDTVVVTPRRRAGETGADRLREELESLPDPDEPLAEPRLSAAPPATPLPVRVPLLRTTPAAKTPPPSASAVQPAATAPAPEAKSPPGDDSELIKSIKGIGGFFGIGGAPNRAEPPAAIPRENRENLRDQPRRKYVPHVPAKRAFENRVEDSGPESPSLAPTPLGARAPVGPQIAGSRAPRDLAPRGTNPFDPETLPQGSVLPLTDPVAGDTPEIAPRKLEPVAERQGTEHAGAQFILSPAKGPTATMRPKSPPAARTPAVPVPPLPEAQKPVEPTAVFERRQVASAPPPAPKEDGGIIKSLATAVGLNEAEPDSSVDQSSEPGDPERILARKMPVLNLRPPLTDVPLTLGASVQTEQRQLPRGLAEPDPCIRRSGGAVMFCVVPIDWPGGIDRAFSLTTYLYQGTRAIARYDGGRATHYHALFASSQYKEVVNYFANRYGPATDEWKRSIAPFDQPRQPNPTLVWRSRDSRTNQVTILEVRQYDDTRNVFPDMDHGAVRLYKSGAQRVFPVITGIDIMGIDWAARSDHTDGVDARALANTIRVGR